MGRVVKDEKELAQAIKNNVDYIEVEDRIEEQGGRLFLVK